MAAYYFIKLPLIEAYIVTSNFNIVCLSETFLDSSIRNNDDRFNIAEYSLLRADHFSHAKKVGR